MFFDKNTSETMPVLLFREQHKSIKKSQSRLLSWSMQYARYIVHQIESQKSCIYICIIFQFVELMLMQKKWKPQKIVNYWLNISRQRFSQLLICISSLVPIEKKSSELIHFIVWLVIIAFSRIFQLNYLETKFKSFMPSSPPQWCTLFIPFA